MMTIYDNIRDEKLRNTTIIEKLQKYEHCRLVKLISMNILRSNKNYLPVKVE